MFTEYVSSQIRNAADLDAAWKNMQSIRIQPRSEDLNYVTSLAVANISSALEIPPLTELEQCCIVNPVSLYVFH